MPDKWCRTITLVGGADNDVVVGNQSNTVVYTNVPYFQLQLPFVIGP